MSDHQTEKNQDSIDSFDARLRQLEETKAKLIGGAIVFAILVGGMFGFTSLYQVPRALHSYVEEELPDYGEHLEEYRRTAEGSSQAAALSANTARGIAEQLGDLLESLQARRAFLRIESGDIRIGPHSHPEFAQTDQCLRGPDGMRGAINERTLFPTTFTSPPQVVLSLNYLDHDVEDEGNLNNLRIRASVTDVDENGFSYDLNTWCDTDIAAVWISWIAYGYER